MTRTSRLAGLAAAAVLSIGGLASTAVATTTHGGHGHDSSAPCSQQQTQVDRAEDALARVTAVFNRQQDKVEKAKEHVNHSDNANQRAKAKRELAKAKHARDEAKHNKHAQQQRLAKAQQRLADCNADQPSSSPTTTAPTEDPTSTATATAAP